MMYYTKSGVYHTTTASHELPFTKTVKLGGSAAPERGELRAEIFRCRRVRSMETREGAFMRLLSPPTARAITMSRLVISGPADSVEALVCEGFYVRKERRSRQLDV